MITRGTLVTCSGLRSVSYSSVSVDDQPPCCSRSSTLWQCPPFVKSIKAGGGRDKLRRITTLISVWRGIGMLSRVKSECVESQVCVSWLLVLNVQKLGRQLEKYFVSIPIRYPVTVRHRSLTEWWWRAGQEILLTLHQMLESLMTRKCL